jgi:hypothetical protein
MLSLAILLIHATGLGVTKQGVALALYAKTELGLTQYRSVSADLNGDGRPEVLLLATDPHFCGSGGCGFFVLEKRGTGYRLVARATITRAPIRLLRTTSHGWYDLSVRVGGGGEPWRQVRLRFDGRRYPSNPSLLPTRPPSPGKVLIDEER